MSHKDLNTGVGYLIRWRGRTQGPLSFNQIERSLDAGQIGLLTEIQVEGRWMSLREFYEAQAAKVAAAPAQPLSGEGDGVETRNSLPAAEGSKRVEFRLRTMWGVLTVAGVLFIGVLACVFLVARGRHREAAPINAATLPASQPGANLTNRAASTSGTNIAANGTLVRSNDVASAGTPPTNAPTTGVSNTNQAAGISLATNVPPQAAVPETPPLPADEPRRFRLKDGTNYFGVIVSAGQKGIIIRLASDEPPFPLLWAYSPQLDWEIFDEQSLAREPKAIAYRKAQEQARLAVERGKAVAAEAAAKAKAERDAEAKRLADYHERQDALIEKSIETFGYSGVTKGYLKGWGNSVTIGEIFKVVAPGAQWTAAKLADYEPERYTHYIVEARWKNDDAERVAMQYLVSADGLNFHLHGCFVSGTKMPDATFLLAVKGIWDRKK